ncbi:MAG: 16S rRNA (cytidine(1402)-2'-O)-methyltransferase [Ruminococcaceae bacterium]|nr:16S rRNA (cytidine(1402)-2'-O)-methyltransferase [Oscillospiraceae bacterium]
MNEVVPGALYIVATPIGNLGDLSPRAISVLSDVDFIAAEDTRVTMKLCARFEIKRPLVSYYENNKHIRGPEIVERLKNGECCALVSDAGTPAISDPGEDLVRLCAEAGVNVYSVPGPCAAISALAVSGLFTGRFVFEGFLSSAKAEKRARLLEVADEMRTLIFYEAPHHLRNTLDAMLNYLGDRRLSIVREITKINEEVIRTTLSGAVEYYKTVEPRGEFVLVIEGAPEKKKDNEFWSEMTILEHYSHYASEGMSDMDAMKAVAKDRGMAKSEVYKEIKINNK